jgi:predicted Zn finger-like uncharacterized protein
MIITCNNCNKNFDVDSNVIPKNGRLLQCNGCNYKWFFKKEIIKDPISPVKIKNIIEQPTPLKENLAREEKDPETIELLDAVIEDAPIIEKISILNNSKKKEIKKTVKDSEIKTLTNEKSYNMLTLTIVFIISFIAIIIVLDTFQKPISMFIPSIEFALYNLYETINDIVLFFNDLIL